MNALKKIVLVPARLRLILIDYCGNGFEQMYQRLGELPLYLSRSYEGECFMTMREGFFKTQAISPVVEEVSESCFFIHVLLLQGWEEPNVDRGPGHIPC